MKGIKMILFFLAFFLVYGLVNYYIYLRGWQAIKGVEVSALKIAFIVAFVFFNFSYFIARMTGKFLPSALTDFLAFTGGMWFAGMLYFMLFIIGFDIIRLIGNGFGLFPEVIKNNWLNVKLYSFIGTLLIVTTIITVGYVNASKLKVKHLSLDIQKPANGNKELHVAVATDIHLGHVIDRSFLQEIIDTINHLKPDLVLFPGDIVDEELYPVVHKDLGELFTQLKPRLGIYAVTGNHEYIGGAEPAVEYLSKFGINFVRDSVVKVDNAFYIAGREDMMMNTFSGKKRKDLKDILENRVDGLPVLLMDHQPVSLSEAAENNVDLQISGHTHHGQMWPLNLITERVFKLSWGYKKLGNSHFYVSSGAGTWGPRVRLGNNPEIVSIKLRFANQ